MTGTVKVSRAGIGRVMVIVLLLVISMSLPVGQALPQEQPSPWHEVEADAAAFG